MFWGPLKIRPVDEARAFMTGENSKLYYVRVAVSVANGMNVKETFSYHDKASLAAPDEKSKIMCVRKNIFIIITMTHSKRVSMPICSCR